MKERIVHRCNPTKLVPVSQVCDQAGPTSMRGAVDLCSRVHLIIGRGSSSSWVRLNGFLWQPLWLFISTASFSGPVDEGLCGMRAGSPECEALLRGVACVTACGNWHHFHLLNKTKVQYSQLVQRTARPMGRGWRGYTRRIERMDAKNDTDNQLMTPPIQSYSEKKRIGAWATRCFRSMIQPQRLTVPVGVVSIDQSIVAAHETGYTCHSWPHVFCESWI